MRTSARERGLTLNEYGLKHLATGKPVVASSERDIFEAVGMDYIDPVQR